MKELLVGLFGADSAPLRWYLFSIGIILSLILQMAKVPALAFALGMYLPIELNVPVLIGGIIAWVVGHKRKGESEAKTKAGHNRGILIASGLMAGGALMGIFDGLINTIIKFVAGGDSLEAQSEAFKSAKDNIHLMSEETLKGPTGEITSIVMLAALCLFIIWYARGAKEDPDAPDLD